MASRAARAAGTPSPLSTTVLGKSGEAGKDSKSTGALDDEEVGDLAPTAERRLPFRAFEELLKLHEHRIVTNVIVALDARLSRHHGGSGGGMIDSADAAHAALTRVRRGDRKETPEFSSAVVPAPRPPSGVVPWSTAQSSAGPSGSPPPGPAATRPSEACSAEVLGREDPAVRAPQISPATSLADVKPTKSFAEQEKELMEANKKLAARRKSSLEYEPDRDSSVLLWGVSRIVRNPRFDSLVTCLILGNSLLIGAHSEWAMTHYSEVGSATPVWIRLLDTAFVVAFTLELLLRVLLEGSYFFRTYNKNVYWNWLDAALVVLGLTDELIKNAWTSAPEAGVFRILRILRLVRVVRVIRVARFFSDLRVMVAGILCSLKSLLWAILLLLIVSFMFGICVMEFVSSKLRDMHFAGAGDCDANPAAADCRLKGDLLLHWGSVIRTIYTLFQAMCGGVDWGMVAEPLVEITSVMGLMFCMYIAVSVFCVMNIVTGVFVENAKMMTAQDQTNQIMQNMEKRRIWFNAVKELWRTLDEEGVGELDVYRFAESLSDVRTQIFFENMGIEVTAEHAEGLFTLLDFNGNGKVDIDELALGIQMLHGSAKGLDVARASYSTMMVRKQLDELVDFCFIDIPRLIGIQELPMDANAEGEEDSDMLALSGVKAMSSSSKSGAGGESPRSPGRNAASLAEMRRSTKRNLSPGKETFPGGANQQCPLEAQVETLRKQSMGRFAQNTAAPVKPGSMSRGTLSISAASLGIGRIASSRSTSSTVHVESQDDGLHRPDHPVSRQQFPQLPHSPHPAP